MYSCSFSRNIVSATAGRSGINDRCINISARHAELSPRVGRYKEAEGERGTHLS